MTGLVRRVAATICAHALQRLRRQQRCERAAHQFSYGQRKVERRGGSAVEFDEQHAGKRRFQRAGIKSEWRPRLAPGTGRRAQRDWRLA